MADASLTAVFGGNTVPLEQACKRAGAAVTDFTAKTAKGAFGDLLAPILKVTAAVGSVGAVMNGIKGALDLGSEMTDLANRTGLAVESAYGLRRAFKDAGVDAQALGPAVNKMQKSLASAVSGGAEGNALKAMGLDPQALASMDPGKAFAEIGNAIAKLPNATERAAASMAIFGKSGAELLQVFMDPNFKDARNISQTAKLLGENAGIFDKASDALGHVGGKLQGLFIGLASGATGLLESMANFIDGLDLSGIGQAFGNAIGNFSTNFSDEWSKVVQFIQDTISLIFSKEGLSVILNSFIYIGSQIRDFLINVFKTPLDYLEAGIQKAMESAMEMIGKIPVLGKQAGLDGFKASSFGEILQQVRDRGNGLQNLSQEDAANKAATGDRLRAGIADLTEKLRASLQPVVTATDATKQANEKARQENANRVTTQGAFNPAGIGQSAKSSIIADSLAKVGGGGFAVGPGGDPILEENKRQTGVLQQILQAVKMPQGSATFDGLTA